MKCPRLLQCQRNCYYGLLCVLDNFFRIFQNNGEIYSSWSNYLVHPVHSNKFEYSLDDRVSRTPSSSSDFHRRLLRLRCYKSRNFVGPKQISSDKEKLKFGSCLTIYTPSSEKEEKPEERGGEKKRRNRRRRFPSGNTNCTFTRVNPKSVAPRRNQKVCWYLFLGGWECTFRGMEIYFHRGGEQQRRWQCWKDLSRGREAERVLAETSSSGAFPSGCKRRWQNPRLFLLPACLRVIVPRNSSIF